VSVEKLQEHRALWAAKPSLREAYGVWFDAMLSGVPRGARVVEVGAGPGLLREHAARVRPDVRWVATDLLPTPWNDLVADAHRLPLRSGSVDVVIGLDVLHHLAAPRDFLAEVSRVLQPRGEIQLLEPWVTPFSFPIYRWLHEEGCRPGLDPWRPFGADGRAKAAFTGDAAVLWKLLRGATPGTWSELSLSRPHVRRLTGFAWLATLGFRKRSLMPAWAGGFLRGVDHTLRPLAALLGMRALVVWRRSDG
jgi:SAM-dependent methyltransferase